MDHPEQNRGWKGHRRKHEATSKYETPKLADETRKLIDQLFERSYTYPQCTEWSLPHFDTLFEAFPWQCDRLQALKVDLNATKNLLSDLDIGEWHKHTQSTHRASYVLETLRTSIKPELCTQAWCKFYEILGTYEIVRPMMGTFSSVHLCEAPGAFITSLNHFIKTRGDYIQWLWLGNTLNPYYEGNGLGSMIDDDRIIFDTLDNWFFGSDNTGDLTEQNNVSGVIEASSSFAPVNLVTADGSIDCANNPGEQESIVAHLHYCELVTALSILAPTGSLVIKMFTMCEDSSIALMYLLNCLFQQVNVIKPTTSKPGNSEVYVVASDFKGISQEWKDTLLSHIGKARSGKAMFSDGQIPPSFIQAHVDCCEKFVMWQMDTIKENLALFKKDDCDTRADLENAKRYCASRYLEKFNVKSIHNSDRIVPPADWVGKKRKLTSSYRPCQSRRHTGSYTKRKEELALPWKQRVLTMEAYTVDRDNSPELQWLQGRGHCVGETCDWQIETGKPFPEIRSSRFCDKDLLQDYYSFLKQVEEDDRTFPIFPRSSTNFILELIRHIKYTEEQLNIVQCEDSCNESFFIAECQKMDVEIRIKTQESRPAGQHLIYLYEEHLQSYRNESKLLLLHADFTVIYNIFQNLQVGDHLVISSAISLTRSRASLMFLLHSHFDQVSMCSCRRGSSAVVYTLCVGYTGCCRSLLQHLSVVSEHCTKDTQSPNSLLSFVPIQNLHEVAFSSYLIAQNNMYLRRRMDFMLEKEKAYWSAVSP